MAEAVPILRQNMEVGSNQFGCVNGYALRFKRALGPPVVRERRASTKDPPRQNQRNS